MIALKKYEGHRVIIFVIPSAPRCIVIKWKGFAYARNGESLVPLDQSKQDEIRNQTAMEDWSAGIVQEATLNDLDELALAKARVMFKKVHSSIPKEEVDGWNNEEFLTRSGVMIDGRLTRAALVLLGKQISAVKLRPAVAQITWVLQKNDGSVEDYQHFYPPFILEVDNVLGKIRNLTMRELPGGTLFPETMKQYDDYSIRETLHNAIAHQDYLMQQRIDFVEADGKLIYSNGGSFIPGTVQAALEAKGPQRYYRNKCLCEAMVSYNMIDTVGRGIRQVFNKQRDRRFPMPDYNINEDKREVEVVIYGKMMDEKYSRAIA